MALESTYIFEEDQQEGTLRPRSLGDFIGQPRIKENLNIFVQAARIKEKAMDHVLLHGPPGLGKTTLAQIVAHELGVNFRQTSGPIITKAGDLAAILTNLQPRDVLFVDEIHRLNAPVEEMLYSAMEDFQLDILIGEGPSARAIRIDLMPFTLVGATTRIGLLTNPLRDRFGIPLHLGFYAPEDLVRIVRRGARILDIEMEAEAALEIARRSRGTPRIAGRLLRRVHDYAVVQKETTVDAACARAALDKLEVDAAGLDPLDRHYLNLMARQYTGGPVGVETLAAALSEQRDTLEDVVEPFLIQEGFIRRTARGRQLEAKGWRHLGLEGPAVPALFPPTPPTEEGET